MIETKNSSCPRMRCKELTLNSRLTNMEFPGLAILLQSCPLVEVLNISDESAFEEVCKCPYSYCSNLSI